MAPKKPAPPHKKQKVETGGANILRFFDKQPEEGTHRHEEGAARRVTPPLGAAADGPSPPPGGGGAPAAAGAAAGGRPAMLKQLAALQDLAPAESFAMSQDTEAMQMQVVWHDSPGGSSQGPPARSLSNLGRGTGPGAAQDLTAIKQRLISAAQKPRDVRRPTGPALAAAAGARLHQGGELLEGLLARQRPVAAQPQQPQQQQQPQQPQQEPSSGSGGGNGAHRTPATQLRSILKRRAVGSAGSGGRRTPASSVKFSLADSGSKGGRGGRGGAAGHLGSSGKKRQAGQKRKALLELLEQVETIVQSGGSPDGAVDVEGTDGAPAAADGAAADAAGMAAVSDKENAADGAPPAKPGSQERDGVAGPTGSQQLMPPPGGVQCCGGLRGRQQPQQGPQQQVPQPQVPQQQMQPQPPPQAQQQGAPAVVQPQQPAQPAAQPAQQSGFDDEDDEDDALMAQLELQLLTQVEAQHAARQAAAAAKQQHNGAAKQQGGTAAHVVPGRPQTAPPAAQHPAAQQAQQQQAQQQQPQQQRRQAHQPAAGQQQQQPRTLPRSPYDRAAPLPAVPAVAVAAAAAQSEEPKPSGPAHTAAADPAAAAALQGSDSGWEDEVDVELLDQFEAAALQERADRSSGGAAGAAGGASGQQAGPGAQPGVAAGEEQPGEAAGQPRYAGGREEVRYEVRDIFSAPHEQVLLLHNKYQKRDVYAHLQPPWCDLPYRVGDAVNVLAQLDFFEGHYHCLLSMEQGMLILHPDILLSGTRITSSNECARRSFLDERIAGDGHNDKAVKGTLTHNLIQAALTGGLRTDPQLKAAAERIVADATEALFEVELSEEDAMACLRQAFPGIKTWMARFLRPEPATDAVLGAGYDPLTNRDVRRRVAVQEVVDIEESIWSTKYGVKGMIDISTQLVLDDPQQQQAQRGSGGWMQAAGAGGPAQQAAGPGGRQVTVAPVEIKTGKLHETHKAQVLLYLLLMEERYGRPLEWGMLWYTHQTDPQLVMKRPMELACLMAVRNRLAAAIAHLELPPLSEDKRACNWCFSQANCALAHKAERGAAAATVDSFVRQSTDRGGGVLDRVQQELAGKYERAAGHMTQADCEFLRKWEGLVTLEEAHSVSRRPEIWSLTGGERQALGRCQAGLSLVHVDEQEGLYTFRRPDGGAIECSFTDGEMLLLSVEGKHVAVARGFFYTCTATQLTVSLNKPLRPGLLWPRGPLAGGPPGAPPPPCDPSVLWRLDRDEASSTFVRLRGNLFALFRREYDTRQDPQTRQLVVGPELPASQHAAKLRRLVVELAPPQFATPDPTQPDPTPPGMNSEQHVAVQRVLAAQDYALVLGMPGAGKTTTIVAMVQALVAAGKSVLLTSYTNSAVDNILMKLAREQVPFLRLGRASGVHPAVRPWLPGGERYPHKNTREWARLAEAVPVFGATCFGVNHALLKDKLFDVCIIDEAGQMVLPASLGPLLKARAFVLVGDHNQLPPLVTCKEAEAGGMGESLFKRLSDAHPQAVVTLPVQYRMAADIMALPNALIYGDALRCGTDSVAQAALELPPGAVGVLAGLPPWLQAALDPQRRVLFLDTAAVEGARESANGGDSGSNSGEAQLVLRFLQAAAAAGVAQEQLGVISPYRAQVAVLDRLARGARLDGVEALTVDKCQGRDKDCIVLSLVKSNAEGEAGKLLQDWRRINVAITRAKRKLLLLGDAATLRSIPLFARLLDLVRQRGWYLQLPADALAGQG